MPQIFELKDLTTDAEIEAAVDVVVAAIRNGETVVLPLESAYVFACDAFSVDAVRHIHMLRGDDYGTAAQVLIGNLRTLDGITQNLADDLSQLAQAFWPGLLTLNVQPHMGLAWDLGDQGDLGEFAVRIPNHSFTLKVLEKSGPLAAASASLQGRPPARSLDDIIVLNSDIAVFVDYGPLEAGPASSVVSHRVIGHDAGLEVIRVGGISLEEMAAVVPALMSENRDSTE